MPPYRTLSGTTSASAINSASARQLVIPPSTARTARQGGPPEEPRRGDECCRRDWRTQIASGDHCKKSLRCSPAMERGGRPDAGWRQGPADVVERALLSSRGAARAPWRPGCGRSPLFFSKADLESSGGSSDEDGYGPSVALPPSAKGDVGQRAGARGAASLICPAGAEPPPAQPPPSILQASAPMGPMRKIRRRRTGRKPSRGHRSGAGSGTRSRRDGGAAAAEPRVNGETEPSSTIELGDALVDGASPPRGTPLGLWHAGRPPARVRARSSPRHGASNGTRVGSAGLSEQLRQLARQNAACVRLRRAFPPSHRVTAAPPHPLSPADCARRQRLPASRRLAPSGRRTGREKRRSRLPPSARRTARRGPGWRSWRCNTAGTRRESCAAGSVSASAERRVPGGGRRSSSRPLWHARQRPARS